MWHASFSRRLSPLSLNNNEGDAKGFVGRQMHLVGRMKMPVFSQREAAVLVHVKVRSDSSDRIHASSYSYVVIAKEA